MNDYTLKALESWYKPDNPLYHDPRHPLIKLAGEAGELLDLYGKHEYKPGFDWWNCKHCGLSESDHDDELLCQNPELGTYHTPLVLDELGDWFYYLRIVTWQRNLSINQLLDSYSEYEKYYIEDDLLQCLAGMADYSIDLLDDYIHDGSFELGHLQYAGYHFLSVLSKLNCTLGYLTDLNYRKLNSDASQHGWSEAR